MEDDLNSRNAAANGLSANMQKAPDLNQQIFGQAKIQLIPDLHCLAICIVACSAPVCLCVYQCMFLNVRWNVFNILIVPAFSLEEFMGSIFMDAV
jgi:hypothetical protein